MKQMINCCLNNTSSLADQSPSEQDNSYILFWNKGAYVAFMEATYEINGGIEHQSTVSMSVGMIRKMFIPPEATNIELEFFMIDSAWVTVGKEFLSTMVKSCYAMWGTIFYPVYAKIACDFDPPVGFDGSLLYLPNQKPCTCITNLCNSDCNINQDNNNYASIKVTNKTIGIIKFDVTFKFGGKIRLIESPKILGLQNRKIKFPLDSTNIALSIVMQVGSRWKKVRYETFGAALVICYEVTGSISTPRCNVVTC